MTDGITSTDLVGTWLLRSWQVDHAGTTRLPFGEQPHGVLTYSEQGWMQATITAPDRPALANPNPRRAGDHELADAFRSCFAYAGPYDVVDGTVVHHVQLSLNPAMVGTDQVREVTLTGTELVLSAPEVTADGSRHHVLHWSRAGEQRP